MKKTCLSCLYEPDWGDKVGEAYPRRYGKCKWDKDIPSMPAIYNLTIDRIVFYADGSGIPYDCETWESKK